MRESLVVSTSLMDASAGLRRRIRLASDCFVGHAEAPAWETSIASEEFLEEVLLLLLRDIFLGRGAASSCSGLRRRF